MKLINIGFGNMVVGEHVIAAISSDSSPVKRMIQEARAGGMLIDATYGRKCKTVFIMDSRHVVLSALATDVAAQRISGENNLTNVSSDD